MIHVSRFQTVGYTKINPLGAQACFLLMPECDLGQLSRQIISDKYKSPFLSVMGINT